MSWETLPPYLAVPASLIYKSTLHFQSAFEDEESALELIRQLGVVLPPGQDWETAVETLLQWSLLHQSTFTAKRRCMLSEMVEPKLSTVETRDTAAIYDSQIVSNLKLQRTVFKSTISQRLNVLEDNVSKEQLETEQQRLWAMRLAEFIQEAELPVCKTISMTSKPSESWLRIFGSRRSKTLRNRARCWKSFYRWLQLVCQIPFPVHVHQLLDYLESVMESKPSKSFPTALAAALSVLETAGQVPANARFSMDPVWKAAVDHWTTQATVGNTTVKQAQLYTTAMIVSLELTVVDASFPLFVRAMAWVVLLMLWGCLRVDDLLGVDYNRFVHSSAGLQGVLTRTKTTGPGKNIKEVPFFIHVDANLTGKPWLEEGYKIWTLPAFSFNRSYFIMKSGPSLQSTVYRMADAVDINAYIRIVLQSLKVPKRTNSLVDCLWKLLDDSKLVPGALVRFWSGHSPRHWAPSVAAAMNVEKDRRDFLGRWQVSKHGSNDYVLTAKQVVHSVQQTIAKGLLEGNTAYEEIMLIRSMGDFADKCELDADTVVEAHSLLIKCSDGSYSLVATFPALQHEVVTNQANVSVIVDQELIVEDTANEPSQSRYWISISRRTGFRRLHLRHACGMLPWNCNQVEDVWTLKDVKADAICKPCAKYMNDDAQAEDSSSSGSSSSEVDEEFVPHVVSTRGDSQVVLSDDENTNIVEEQEHLVEIEAGSNAGANSSWVLD